MRLLLLTTLLILPAMIFAAPGIPHQLHGTVKDFTDGTLSVVIDDEVIATTTIQSDGTFGKSPNLFFVSDANGTLAGKTMKFKINAANANGDVVFVNGGVTQLHTELLIIGRDTPSGTVSTPAPVSAPVVLPSISAPKGDFDGDGVIDVKDFNFFIANWGSSETDLNGDGVTDILDFNMLMANWK